MMNEGRFYDDNSQFFDFEHLRGTARDIVQSSSLIRRGATGDKGAVTALHVGFWPFVREFEIAIDKHRLPRAPLRTKFGAASEEGRVNLVFAGLAAAVATMKKEEGSHAAHWRKDAEGIGLMTLGGSLVPGVRELIDASYTENLPYFFSVLAGTEFIAEELSAFLTRQPAFTNLFSRKRWVWGDVHLIPHDDGPSHLEIDLDLARAYSDNDVTAKSAIPNMIIDTIGLFDKAASEVEAAYTPL